MKEGRNKEKVGEEIKNFGQNIYPRVAMIFGLPIIENVYEEIIQLPRINRKYSGHIYHISFRETRVKFLVHDFLKYFGKSLYNNDNMTTKRRELASIQYVRIDHQCIMHIYK